MVFYLLESTHLGNVASFYLNIVQNKHFRPYDLITVPKTQVKFILVQSPTNCLNFYLKFHFI